MFGAWLFHISGAAKRQHIDWSTETAGCGRIGIISTTRTIDPRLDRQNMPLLGAAWIWFGPTDGGVGPQFRSLGRCAQVEQLEPHRPEHWGEQLINPVTSQVKLGMKIHEKSYLRGLIMKNGIARHIIWKMTWNCHIMDCRLLSGVSVSFFFHRARWSHTIHWPSVDSSTDLLTCNFESKYSNESLHHEDICR